MITKKTVFILGAGASKPYQYPVGSELYDKISSTAIDEDITSVYFLLKEIQWESDKERLFEEIVAFKERIRRAQFSSIDFFLEQNPDDIMLGKLFITKVLLENENIENFYCQNNWYKYLFNNFLKTTFDKMFENKISFLTFNYDRSLEYYFYSSIKNGYPKVSDIEIKNILDNYNFIHLYGDLGHLPYQSSAGFDYSYKEEIRERLKFSIQSLHLIAEERNESFKKAHLLIKDAEYLCFLGFGFDKTNLERLDISLMQGKKVIASGFGIEEAERVAIINYFKQQDVELLLGQKSDDCYFFLRRNFDREL